MEFKQIRISDIDYEQRPLIPNFHYLLASARTSGITTPITVRVKEDGRYNLIDGYQRVQVARELGRDTIIANILYAEDRNA